MALTEKRLDVQKPNNSMNILTQKRMESWSEG